MSRGRPSRPVVPTERRIPGYVIVLVFVLIGALATASVLLVRPGPVAGPPVLLLRAEDSITATPANASSVPADFGPHCTAFEWNPRTGALAVQSDVDLTGARGVVLQHFTPVSSNFASLGGDGTRGTLYRSTTGWTLASPIDGHTLTVFGVANATVTAEGTAYPAGSSWTMTFEYDATTPAGIVHVVEVITFTNQGTVPTHFVPPAACM